MLQPLDQLAEQAARRIRGYLRSPESNEIRIRPLIVEALEASTQALREQLAQLESVLLEPEQACTPENRIGGFEVSGRSIYFSETELVVLRRAVRLIAETDMDTGPALLGIDQQQWTAMRTVSKKLGARDPGDYPDEKTEEGASK